MQPKLNTHATPISLRQRLQQFRAPLSQIITMLILAALVYWGWQSRAIFQQIFVDLGPIPLTELFILLTVGVILSSLSFTILVHAIGYPFTYLDGYHSLNLAQIAAMIPGKIWGFAGLAAFLWSRGISKRDSVLIISLHTLFMLSAAVFVGTVGLVSIVGWGYTILCLTPVLLLLLGRPWLDNLRNRFFAGSSPLPSSANMLLIFILGVISWIIVSLSFALLVYHTEKGWPIQPMLLVSAFPAGYVGGFVALITPLSLIHI